jgi:hypothetical protein
MTIKRVFYFICGASATLFCWTLFTNPTPVSSANDTCTWTGATNANWSIATNWTGCDNGNVPETGDALIFPTTASNKAMQNDTTLSFIRLQFDSDGYSVSGSPVRIENTVSDATITGASGGSGSVTFNSRVEFTTNNTNEINVLSGKTITFVNGISSPGNGSALTAGALKITIQGGGTVDFQSNINQNTVSTQFVVQGSNTRVKIQGAVNSFGQSGAPAISNGATLECFTSTCVGNSAIIPVYLTEGTLELRGAITIPVAIAALNGGQSSILAFDNATIGSSVVALGPLQISQSAANKTLIFSEVINNLNQPITLTGVNRTSVIEMINPNFGLTGNGDFIVSSVNLVLSGQSSFNDQLIANQGNATITANNQYALGSTGGKTIIGNGDILEIGASLSDSIEATGNGTGSGAVIFTGTNPISLSGTLTPVGSATINKSSISTPVVLNGAITGTGDLTLKNGTYSIAGNSPNTHSGKIIIDDGYLVLNKFNTLPGIQAVGGDITLNGGSNPVNGIYLTSPEQIIDTSTITVNPGTTDMNCILNNYVYENIGKLVGNCTVQSGLGSQLNLTSNDNYTFSAKLETTVATNTVIDVPYIEYSGNGTRIITGSESGTSSVLPTPLTVSNGSLVLTNNGFINTPVTVAQNAQLKGVGTVGDAKLSTGATLAPGNSPGCIGVSSLVLVPSSNFIVEINGTTVCTQYDQVAATGAVDLGNSTLTVLPTIPAVVADVYTILTSSALTGTFNGYNEGSSYTANGNTYRVSYLNNNVTLTVTASSAVTTTSSSSSSNSTTPPLIPTIISQLITTGNNYIFIITFSAIILGSAVGLMVLRKKQVSTKKRKHV